MKVIYKGFEIEAFRDWNMLYSEKFVFANCTRIKDGLTCGSDCYPADMSVREVIADCKFGLDDRLKDSGCKDGNEEADKSCPDCLENFKAEGFDKCAECLLNEK